jgi:hypothetical protein
MLATLFASATGKGRNMPSLKSLRLHAGLVDDMANILDVDLEEATIRGDVSLDQLSEAVLRCTDCPNPDNCQTLLAQASSLSRTPEYCRNKDLLHKLMP